MVAHISSNPNSSPFLQLADYKHFSGDTQMKNGVPLHYPDGILRFSGDTGIFHRPNWELASRMALYRNIHAFFYKIKLKILFFLTMALILI